MSDHAETRELALRMHAAGQRRPVVIEADRQAPLDGAARRTALLIGVETARSLGENLERRLVRRGLRVFLAGPDVKPLIEAARTLAARGIDVAAVVADLAAESEVAALFDLADLESTLELVVFNDGHDLLNGAVRRWKATVDVTSSHAVGPIVGARRSFSSERNLQATRG